MVNFHVRWLANIDASSSHGRLVRDEARASGLHNYVLMLRSERDIGALIRGICERLNRVQRNVHNIRLLQLCRGYNDSHS